MSIGIWCICDFDMLLCIFEVVFIIYVGIMIDTEEGRLNGSDILVTLVRGRLTLHHFRPGTSQYYSLLLSIFLMRIRYSCFNFVCNPFR